MHVGGVSLRGVKKFPKGVDVPDLVSLLITYYLLKEETSFFFETSHM